MARIRTIKPTFFRSRAVRRLSSNDVRMVWVGLWPLSDDEGRMLDEPEILVGDLWALGLSVEELERALTELHEQGRIVRYSVGGERFMQVTNWSAHQRIQKPSPSEIPPVELRDDSGSPIVQLSVGREGKGREGSAIATPFCERHPTGIDGPCRACGDARRAYDAALAFEKNKPTPTPPKVDPTPMCPIHEGYPSTEREPCAACARDAVAS